MGFQLGRLIFGNEVVIGYPLVNTKLEWIPTVYGHGSRIRETRVWDCNSLCDLIFSYSLMPVFKDSPCILR